MADSRIEKLAAFTAWAAAHISGDEKGEAHIFLDHLFQAFGQPGSLEVGEHKFRIRKAGEDGGGTSFADFVWKPVVLIEIKKRGVNLAKHYRQAFDYRTRLVPARPRYVILCNFDEFHVYDFETQMDSPVGTVALVDLPAHHGPLNFLFPRQPAPRFKKTAAPSPAKVPIASKNSPATGPALISFGWNAGALASTEAKCCHAKKLRTT